MQTTTVFPGANGTDNLSPLAYTLPTGFHNHNSKTNNNYHLLHKLDTFIECTKLDTVSKFELSNVFLTVSHSVLNVTDGNFYVQETRGILQSFNFDAKLFSSQITSIQICHDIASSIVCSGCSSN